MPAPAQAEVVPTSAREMKERWLEARRLEWEAEQRRRRSLVEQPGVLKGASAPLSQPQCARSGPLAPLRPVSSS